MSKQEKVNETKEKLTSKEDEIHAINKNITKHNEKIRMEVKQELESPERNIEMIKNRLSSLKCIESQIDGTSILRIF